MQARRAAAGLTLLMACAAGLAWAKAARAPQVLFPSDLGPAGVDVSGYPPELRRIYAQLLPGKCGTCHSLARALNAPVAELSEEEEARERARNPALFEDPQVLKSGPESWKIYIKRMFMRPPCCGSCGVWTKEDIRQVHDFLSYDSRIRKTGARAGRWIVLRKRLVKEFEKRRLAEAGAPIQEAP